MTLISFRKCVEQIKNCKIRDFFTVYVMKEPGFTFCFGYDLDKEELLFGYHTKEIMPDVLIEDVTIEEFNKFNKKIYIEKTQKLLKKVKEYKLNKKLEKIKGDF